MNVFFAPIAVIMMVCLLLECLSLLIGDCGFALACRLILTMLLYIAYVLKREQVQHALKKKRKLLRWYNYVLFVGCTLNVVCHTLFLCFLTFKLYSACIVLFSLLIIVDEYLEIEWLKQCQSLCDDGETDIELRTSLYYTVFKWLQPYKPRPDVLSVV